jgi:hypothetical protein
MRKREWEGLTMTDTVNCEDLLALAAQLPPAERRRVARELSGGGEAVEWRRPNTVVGLARAFGIGRAAMSRRLRDGTVRAKRFGRYWRVAVEDLPVLPAPRR